MAENIPNRNEVIESKMLIGLDIKEAQNKLGYWWACSSCHVNAWTREGVYVFYRAGHGRLELRTNNNIVEQVL